MRKNGWCAEELRILQENWQELTDGELSELLPGRSAAAIATIRKKMGLVGGQRFTDAQIAEVKSRYHNTLTRQLAAELGRTEFSIYQLANRLGIKKDKAFIATTKRAIILCPNHGARKSQFKKGNITFNKGKKQSEYLTPEQIERTKATRFQKGHKPHNTRSDGELSWRNGYYWIRISESNWKLLHRHVWEQKNGTIPAGHNIIFLDGNSKNCTIENLACVSNADLADMNRITQYPEELRQAIRLKNKLNKAINSKKDGKH